jgi:CheY-like chemotaxis protein
LSKLKIVVADDSRDQAALLAAVLKLQGHVVHTAINGREALDLALMLRPHVVVLDLAMPLLDGLEVANAIRKEAWGAQPALIAISGYAEDEHEAERPMCTGRERAPSLVWLHGLDNGGA